jgi:predicted SAM-dependent methyltransferase
MGLTLVNVGCGAVFHPAWTNLDSNPVAGVVKRWDVRRGLPFSRGEVDAVYASHILEHLPRDAVPAMLAECHRALRSGGVLRVVVPDLEGIARAYLRSLETALSGAPDATADHEWMTVELLDQLVRTQGGGEIHRLLTSGTLRHPQFVIERLGVEAEQLVRGAAPAAGGGGARQGLRHYLRRVREEAAIVLAGLVLGREGAKALREGLFRRSGQLHLWMYDRASLQRLLHAAGFADIAQQTAWDSRIPGFATYELDTLDGRVRKPDSLFMEALKP